MDISYRILPIRRISKKLYSILANLSTSWYKGSYITFTLLMKKIIAPIAYLLFVVPAFILTLNVWNLYEGIFGLRSFFGRQGDLEGAVIFIIVTSATFYLGNFLIQKIDHTKQPTVVDHLGQSALFYVLFIYQAIQQLSWLKQYPISECQSDCHGYAIGALFVLIPLLGIIINAFYLFRRRKVNVI